MLKKALPFALLSAALLGGCFHGPVIPGYPLLDGEMKAHFTWTVDGKYTADLKSYAGVEEFIDRYGFWADTLVEFPTSSGAVTMSGFCMQFPSLEVGTYTEDMLDRMDIVSNYLLRINYDGGDYTPNDGGSSWQGRTNHVDGDATVIIEGSEEKYIYGSFSGTLVADVTPHGTSGLRQYRTIEVKGTFVFMKDWFDL